MQSINNTIIGCNSGNIKLAGPDNFAYYKILDKEILLFGESHTLIPKNNYHLDIFNFFYNIANGIPAESCIDFFIEDSFYETYEKYNQNGGSNYKYLLESLQLFDGKPAILYFPYNDLSEMTFSSVEYNGNTYSGKDIKIEEDKLNGFPKDTIVTLELPMLGPLKFVIKHIKKPDELEYSYVLYDYPLELQSSAFKSVEYNGVEYLDDDIIKKEKELKGFPENTKVKIEHNDTLKTYYIYQKGPFYLKYRIIDILRSVLKHLLKKKTPISPKNNNQRYHFWDIAQHKKFHPSWISYDDGKKLEFFDENTFKNLCRLFLGQFDLINESDAVNVYNRYVENIKSSDIDSTSLDNINFDIKFIKYIGMKINKQLDNIMIPEFQKKKFVEDMIDYYFKKSKDSYDKKSNLRIIMTDIYSFARMFRNFDKDKIIKNVCDQYLTPNKIIYYGGSTHFKNILYMLEYLFPSTPPIMKNLDPNRNKYVIIPKHNYFGLDLNKLFSESISPRKLDDLFSYLYSNTPIQRLIINCNSKN